MSPPAFSRPPSRERSSSAITRARWRRGLPFWEPIGALILKGKAEPISAYRLVGFSHRRSGLREAPSPRTAVFVDRESEIAILNNFLRQVENGHGQAVGLVGEPGIGKSRLLAEFRRPGPRRRGGLA